MSWWDQPRTVTVCVDTPCWFDEYARRLVDIIQAGGDHATLTRVSDNIPRGGITFFLSCMRLVPSAILDRSHQNLVVHASALPQGKGFSPLVWQVLEGKNEIPVSMILATEQADAGNVVMRDSIRLEGHELNDEMRQTLGRKIVDMCDAYLRLPAPPTGEPQTGEESWYPRRRAGDSALNPTATLAEQFDLLRVVDNERYPAFFDWRGKRYTLRIEKIDISSDTIKKVDAK